MVDAQDALLVQLDRQLCFKLYAASRLMIKAYRPLLEALEITYPQYLVLMVLWEHKSALTIGELGEKLLLDTGTLTPLLKRMAAQGLVERRRGETDERQVWVTATSKGAALQRHAIDWVKASTGKLNQGGLDTGVLAQQLRLLLEVIK